MAHKLETLFRKIVGYSPNKLEPKPTRNAMCQMIASRRDGTFDDSQKILFDDMQSRTVKSYELVEIGREGGEQYTLFSREMNNKTIEYSFLFGTSVSERDIESIASSIPSSDWFSNEALQ